MYNPTLHLLSEPAIISASANKFGGGGGLGKKIPKFQFLDGALNIVMDVLLVNYLIVIYTTVPKASTRDLNFCQSHLSNHQEVISSRSYSANTSMTGKT